MQNNNQTYPDASQLLIKIAALGPTAKFESKTITTPQRPGKVMKFTEHGTLYRWHWFLFVPYKRRYTVHEAVEYFG